MSWITCAAVLLGAELEATSTSASVVGGPSIPVTGNSSHAVSENFVVTSHHPARDARTIAQLCERSRAQLQSCWCEGQAESWSPSCSVIVHSTQSSYLASVGAGAAQTAGSS
jgi:hypothetical protein